jgi:tetratricopeptide (TPR) repeat protein
MFSASVSRLKLFQVLIVSALLFGSLAETRAQAGNHKLFGDLHVDESKAGETVPLSYEILLYSISGNLLQQVSIPNRGRYQFLGLPDAYYDVVVQVEDKVVARFRVSVFSPFRTDFRQDIELQWRDTSTFKKTSAVSAEDLYQRSPANDKLFRDALKLQSDGKNDQAALLFQKLVAMDIRDFQAWCQLANLHFIQRKYAEAENEYLHAIDARPGFFLAMLNLGRLELTVGKYDVATEALQKAVALRRDSPDANYFLGDAYLKMKKGSVAVDYLNEALRLDPNGMAEVHLQLAALYDGAGLRDKAAAEYEQFLKKRPEYGDRKKLQRYIAENRKR